MTIPSVQLYSLRDAISSDLEGTLDRVRQIGFTQVEPYAFNDDPARLSTALRNADLVAPTGHVSVIDASDPVRAFEAALDIGISTVIDPFIPTERWQTTDDVARLAERVNELTDVAHELGLRFGYHNHQWEFTTRIDGVPAFQLFVDQLQAKTILEIDTFWATVAGMDVPSLLRGLDQRIVAIHVKDGKVEGDIRTALPSSESALVVPDQLRRAFAEQTPAGQGDVDVQSILQAAPQALRVVEFDDYAGDVFDGIAQSLAWLNAHDVDEAAR
ncbi:sugar phosphate isomerase/epimerase [Tsukamurella strandjordii]|uniref:sugar phosphate isomerase/epimerase family protein n=1 Tax=Tsukamurella strandjordii TaxID=147577 RepID=UPI0031D19870